MSVSQLLDQGSISFGRFSIESLSWEKWSVFSHNKCQEELEKFKAPGLVAQKKAYFEEYYKRIRNLKAIQAEQEVGLESDPCQDGHYCTQTCEHDQIKTTTQPGYTIDVTTTEEGKANSGDDPQIQLSEMNEVTEQQRSAYGNLDDKEIVKNEFEVSVSKVSSAIETGTKSKVSISRRTSQVAVKNNCISNHQVKLSVKKRYDHIPIPKAKEDSASTRTTARLDSRAKPDAVKPSEGLRNPIHKFTKVKAENNIVSIKPTSNKVSSNMKSASVSSHRQLTEVRPNVTISCPSILAIDRKLASTRVRDGAAKRHLNSKASTIKSPSSLPIQAQGQSCNQSISKEMPGGVKSIASKSKRTSEDMTKSPNLVSQCVIPKGKEAEDCRTKAMSTKQPVRSKSNKDNVIEYNQRSDVRGKQKEGKMGIGMGGYGSGSKLTTSVLPKAPKIRNKIAISCSANLIPDGSKPRQGMSSWR